MICLLENSKFGIQNSCEIMQKMREKDAILNVGEQQHSTSRNGKEIGFTHSLTLGFWMIDCAARFEGFRS
jgi:hypothetical protein